MPSERIVTAGIVLRETDFQESDRILTLLTPDYGKIRVMARATRRKNCKYLASAQPLTLSEWTLNYKKDWYYAQEGDARELFAGLHEDLTALSLGFYMAELTGSLVLDEEPAIDLFRHLLNGLYALSELKKAPELVKPAFELRLLSLAGFKPLADVCISCRKSFPDTGWLDVVQGIIRCTSCGPIHKSTSSVLNRGAMSALRHCLYGDAERLYAFQLDDVSLRQLSRAAERFMFAQLERRFSTLDFYHSLSAVPVQHS